MKGNTHIGQNVLIAVLALVTLFFAVLTVMAMIPAETDVEISETITVSSSRLNALDEEVGAYVVEASGMLRNTTGNIITVSRLSIPADGFDSKQAPVILTAENIVIPPRSSVAVIASAAASENCHKTGEITALIDGDLVFLRNPADISAVSVLIPLFLALVAGFFCFRACQIRYYMAQEKYAK